VALAVLAAGCSSSKSSSAGGTSPSTAATTTTAPEAAKVNVTAKDYSYDIPPMPSGVVQITLTNAGQQPHDLQLVRIDGSHTLAEFKTQVAEAADDAPIPTWVHGAGGVGTVGPGAPPGVAWVKLDAGATYFFFCTETTDDNKKHSSLGMLGQLQMQGASPANALPAADATLVAKDYSFDIPGLKAGPNTIVFRNDGPNQLHHFVAAPITAGKTLDDVKAALASQNPTGPPPLDFQKAVSVSATDPGQLLSARMTFAPGKYAFLCFLTDHAGGPPHFTKGMISEYTIPG
jgi:hypothetical protein